MPKYITNDESNDGINRRGFLTCMAWAGAGMVWAVRGGVLRSRAFGTDLSALGDADFTFAQVSDSHVGFNKGVYNDVVGTFRRAVERVNALAALHERRLVMRFEDTYVPLGTTP
jgi:hypothetical protein